MKNGNTEHQEELIRKVETTYDAAWRQSDLEGIMACFTENAIIVSPRGDVANGKKEIRALLGEFLNNIAKDSKHTSRIVRISFVTDDVAVVDGVASIEGAQIDQLSNIAQHRFTDILVRSGDTWRIAQIRAYAIL